MNRFPFMPLWAAAAALVAVAAPAFAADGPATVKLTLAGALAVYGKNSRQVAMLRSEREAKSYLVSKAEALRRPSLDADVSYTFLNAEPKSKTPFGNLPLSEDRYFKGQLVLSHIIYDFGQRDSVIGAAAADRDLTALYLAKDLNDSGADIAALFYRILALRKAKDVLTEELDALETHKKQVQSFYDEGVVTRNELLQVNVEILNTRQKILAVENDETNGRMRLRTLLNIAALPEPVDDDGGKKEPLVYDGAAVHRQRPEVAIAEKLIALKNLELKRVDAGGYPSIYGATGLNVEENKYRVDDYSLFLSLGLRMNLYGGGRTTSERLSVIKGRQELEEKLALVKDLVTLDVETAVNDVQTALGRIDVTGQAIGQAKENLRIQHAKYAEHLIPVTDLIDATLIVSKTYLDYYNALYGYKAANARFAWARGLLHTVPKE